MTMPMLMLAADYISPAFQEALQIIAPILMIIMVLLAISLTVIILMQSGNVSEITAISGGNQNSYAGKNKGEDKAGRLKKVTYILGAAMLLVSILYFVLQLIGRQ